MSRLDKYQQELELAETRQVTLNANGEGWIRYVGPVQSWESWVIHSTQSSVIGATQPTKLKVYANGGSTFVDSTYDGNLNTSDSQWTLMPGQYLSYHYSEGTPGAVATLAVYGVRRVRSAI